MFSANMLILSEMLAGKIHKVYYPISDSRQWFSVNKLLP